MIATEAAAWWGAITGSLVLVWDIFKWSRSGARLSVTATANMQYLPPGSAKLEEQNYVVVVVSNRGDNKTTLTHLVGMHYKNSLLRILRRKPTTSFFVPTQSGKQLPYQLSPGDQWTGMIEQNEKLERMMEDVLYVGVYHSSGSKGVLKRVRRK